MPEIMIITGTSKGIGRHLVEYYMSCGYTVVGCSRSPMENPPIGYTHFCLDVSNEDEVQDMVQETYRQKGDIGYLINNAGIASMNHFMLTPMKTVQKLFSTNVYGTFLFCREVAKVMSRKKKGRIVNFATIATPIKLEGEASYAASKAAVESYTRVMARELSNFNITVNAVGPTPVATDLIRGVPEEKIQNLLKMQAIPRLGEMKDITNVIDFFIQPGSDFITGQVLYLGGVS